MSKNKKVKAQWPIRNPCISSQIQWVDDQRRENIQLGATDSVVPMEDGKRTIVTSKLLFKPRRHHNNQTITCLASNQALSSPLSE